MAIKHLAVNIGTESKEFDKIFSNIKKIVEYQIKQDIRILTIGIPDAIPDESLVEFFKFYMKKEHLNKNQVKLSIVGKWYDLSGPLLDTIKGMIDETKEYDKYFLNFAINYNGQEEIVDACKIMCRQVQAGKLDLNKINRNSIKDNLYSSYFMPPELIIITGKEQKTKSFLLWDSGDSKIMFTGEDFADFSIDNFQI
jgi:undecaprenyl diphosphate synthase